MNEEAGDKATLKTAKQITRIWWLPRATSRWDSLAGGRRPPSLFQLVTLEKKGAPLSRVGKEMSPGKRCNFVLVAMSLLIRREKWAVKWPGKSASTYLEGIGAIFGKTVPGITKDLTA